MNEKLRAARLARNWTIAQIARFLAINKSAVGRWENEGIVPKEINVKRLCAIFKMTRQELGFHE